MERELILLELKNIRRSRVEMDVVPAVLFESFFIFPNFYPTLPLLLAFCHAWIFEGPLQVMETTSLIAICCIRYAAKAMLHNVCRNQLPAVMLSTGNMPHIICAIIWRSLMWFWVQEVSVDNKLHYITFYYTEEAKS